MNLLTAGNSEKVYPGKPSGHESDQTTHFSVVDSAGNAVSLTYTLNGYFGCKAVAEGTGILLNNEMDDFSIKPGYPNMFGLVGSEANAIAPHKRMLSSMTPTIVLKGGSLFMALGSPGGSKIITNVAQVISNAIDFNMNIRQAIESPRFHHQWRPDSVFLETGRFSLDTIQALENLGYRLVFKTYMGYVQGIKIENGKRTGWADPRSNGQAAGY
jgi:gamma-glutamyltranspeptidase/glutathione hydrolase